MMIWKRVILFSGYDQQIEKYVNEDFYDENLGQKLSSLVKKQKTNIAVVNGLVGKISLYQKIENIIGNFPHQGEL